MKFDKKKEKQKFPKRNKKQSKRCHECLLLFPEIIVKGTSVRFVQGEWQSIITQPVRVRNVCLLGGSFPKRARHEYCTEILLHVTKAVSSNSSELDYTRNSKVQQNPPSSWQKCHIE